MDNLFQDIAMDTVGLALVITFVIAVLIVAAVIYAIRFFKWVGKEVEDEIEKEKFDDQ